MDQVTKLEPRDEITFRDLVQELRVSKRLIFSLVLGFTLVGIAIGALRPREYQASTVLSPAAEGNTSRLGGLAALASQYGGLASLAGIDLAGGGKKDESVAVLQSELLTERYIRENNLLPILYAKMLDRSTGKWLTTDPKNVPTLWKANRYFKTIRGVIEDKKSGLVIVTITWTDPKLATKWANDLVRLTNVYLRDKAIAECERNIAYLNEQASRTTVIEAQKAIYSLLQTEIDKEMVARGREEYALKVIDPAFVPEKPSSAGPVLLGLLGFGLGCTVAILFVFARKALSA
jgi:uncharacterized protein involved in exopolysaccharide biosynthesis